MYSIVENEPTPTDGNIHLQEELIPTFQVYKDGVVVYYATTRTACEVWIAQQG
jgi:hypothetical protein|tara:strand:- start:93 stop:251 length:159 start_codon:yes stop_codon:yes gene_type:complete